MDGVVRERAGADGLGPPRDIARRREDLVHMHFLTAGQGLIKDFDVEGGAADLQRIEHEPEDGEPVEG